jgi:hypothetical protein
MHPQGPGRAPKGRERREGPQRARRAPSGREGPPRAGKGPKAPQCTKTTRVHRNAPPGRVSPWHGGALPRGPLWPSLSKCTKMTWKPGRIQSELSTPPIFARFHYCGWRAASSAETLFWMPEVEFQSSPERVTLALPLLGPPANHNKNPAEFKSLLETAVSDPALPLSTAPSGAPPSPGPGRIEDRGHKSSPVTSKNQKNRWRGPAPGSARKRSPGSYERANGQKQAKIYPRSRENRST